MPLDPTLKRLFSIAYAKGYGKMHERTPEEARLFLKQLFKDFMQLPKPAEAASTQELPMSKEHLRIRCYFPKEKTKVPPLLFWRASAYLGGKLEDTDERCQSIANTLQTMVISIDYPCLPTQFPVAFDRSLQTVEWLLEQDALFGYSLKQCYFWGESCGATITLSVAQRLSKALKAHIQQVVLFYPDMDNTGHYASHQAYGTGYLADQHFRHWIYGYFLSDPSQRTDPRLCPLRGPMADLPPCLCITAECDPLRDETYAFHALATEQGLSVQTITYLGLSHGFLLHERLVPKARLAFEDTLRFLLEQGWHRDLPV